MRYSPLIVAASLLALGGLLALPCLHQPLGIGLGEHWQLALIHAEMALATLVFLPARSGRTHARGNLVVAAACWAAGGAAVLLFSFSAHGDLALSSRALSAAVWLACSGLLSLAARGPAHWLPRARVLLLCAFGLPPLWHYLALEYGGTSALHLRPLSPNWSLAAGDVNLWPLLLAGLVCWAIAFALPERRQA